MSTICALSTANAEGGISVIRMSGEKSIDIADRIFKAFSKIPVKDMKGHTCAYGRIYDEDKIIDDVVLTVFIAPKSYTGEDTVEISCHGGIYVTRKVVEVCIKNGAEPAQAGEFTKRAFLNGKLSLTQAEAVMDIISAQGELTLNSANSTHSGALFNKISSVAGSLTKALGELAAWVDYPEEDLPEVENDTLLCTIKTALDELKTILRNYDNGMLLKNGIDTAIVGKPNVGKSTLMNMLLGFDRCIVTDIAGTTRDVIEETARIGDYILKLSDTAGIRESHDKVENIGIEIAHKKLTDAILVLAVFDSSTQFNNDDIELLKNISDKRAIVILNKSDLESCISKEDILPYCKNIVEISAKNSQGFDSLCNCISKVLEIDRISGQDNLFANKRQKNCVLNAVGSLEKAEETLNIGMTLDAVTVEIDEALQSLLELTGEKASEKVVDEVFSKFCVGK